MSKVTLTRSPMNSIGLDITVKSAKGSARLLAPTWTLVMGLKEGKITQEQYTAHYYKILEMNLDQYIVDSLAKKDRNFKCYCANGEFCHTYLLINYLISKYPHQFQTTPEIQLTLQQLNIEPLMEEYP